MSNNSSLQNGVCGAASVKCASNVESTQWTKMHTPHAGGFAAEDYNALCDKLCGKQVDKVGLNNELNGADRIVDGIKIQTKYCRSAYDSVSNAFDADGNFRYPGMKLEVPKGQGEDAVRIMEERIKAGRVPGVTDPAEARNIVMEGHCTYEQAAKIAKAGNLESIKFDVMNQMVTCACIAGLSFVVGYAVSRMGGLTREAAVKSAVSQALKAGAITITAGVATQQFLRTQVGRHMAVGVNRIARTGVNAVCRTQAGRAIVEKMMAGIIGKSAAQSAARNACVKLLRTNAFTSAAIAVVTIVPDVIKVCCGRKSWKQVGKNATVNVAGIGGGSAGAWAGTAAGAFLGPVGAVAGGIIGGLAGGIVGSFGAKKGMDYFIKDDSERCLQYVEDAIVSLCDEHQTSEEQLNSAMKLMRSKNVFKESFFEKMYKAGGKNREGYLMRAYAERELSLYFA